jgi:hypothetical protein
MIQRALAELNARNVGGRAPQLAARIGLDSGPVVVDSQGEVFGEAPNVAARVQALAEPGAVVVTANVHRQVAGLFVARSPRNASCQLGARSMRVSARSLKVSVVTVRVEPFGPLPGAVFDPEVELKRALRGEDIAFGGRLLILYELVSCAVRRWRLRFLRQRGGWNRQGEAGKQVGQRRQ